jgi:hypothetical protein
MSAWNGLSGRGETIRGRSRLRGAAVLFVATLGVACGPPHLKPAGDSPSSGTDAFVPPAGPPILPTFDGGARPSATGPCAGEAHQADVVPLDLMLLLDTSSSMNSGAGLRTRWELAQLALSAFIRDPASAGLGVGVQFFPLTAHKPCTTDQDCAVGTELCGVRRACPGPDPVTPGRSCRVDATGPMNDTCGGTATCVPTGACAASGALCTNVGQACPSGAGTCVAFPRVCVTNVTAADECNPATYAQPAAPIGELPAAQDALLATLNGHFATGGTPMRGAVLAALDLVRAHLASAPGHKGALVLVSDGAPNACGSVDTIAKDVAAALAGSPSIATHVIGLISPVVDLDMAREKLERLAAAGSGNKAIFLDPNSNLTSLLQDALSQIRGTLACEYRIPMPVNGTKIDFGKVNVHYTDEGASEDIPYVERADRCDPVRGGWYYDVSPASGAPARVLTCEATCRRLRGSLKGKVELVFGCATRVIE